VTNTGSGFRIALFVSACQPDWSRGLGSLRHSRAAFDQQFAKKPVLLKGTLLTNWTNSLTTFLVILLDLRFILDLFSDLPAVAAHQPLVQTAKSLADHRVPTFPEPYKAIPAFFLIRKAIDNSAVRRYCSGRKKVV
jgi:hypothetical protein